MIDVRCVDAVRRPKAPLQRERGWGEGTFAEVVGLSFQLGFMLLP